MIGLARPRATVLVLRAESGNQRRDSTIEYEIAVEIEPQPHLDPKFENVQHLSNVARAALVQFPGMDRKRTPVELQKGYFKLPDVLMGRHTGQNKVAIRERVVVPDLPAVRDLVQVEASLLGAGFEVQIIPFEEPPSPAELLKNHRSRL